MPLFQPTPILSHGVAQPDGSLVFSVPNPCGNDTRPGYTGADAVFGVNDLGEAVASPPGSAGGYEKGVPIKGQGVVVFTHGGKSGSTGYAMPYVA
jgi:hypothetical protein